MQIIDRANICPMHGLACPVWAAIAEDDKEDHSGPGN